MGLKIYPTPLIDLRSNEIGIEKVSITYCQPLDESQEGDHDYNTQQLTISTEVSGACVGSSEIARGEEKDGFYLVLSTERWAIDDENDIVGLIKDFKERMHLNIPKKEE